MNQSSFIISTLADNPEYTEEVISLIENEFGYGNDYHYEIDFAPLFEPTNFENCFIIIDKNKNIVASHLAFTKRKLIKKNAAIDVLLLGGIVTHKKYRGQKLFSTLMNKTINENKDIGLFILWSDLKEIYEKFGFYLSAGTIECGKNIITRDNIPDYFEKTTFNALTDQDFNSIINLYKKNIEANFFTIKRELNHWSTIKKMSSIDLYIKRNSFFEIESYFCLGKGRDLTGIIHEVASGNIHELLNTLSKYKLWLPEYYKNDFINCPIQYTAFFKIGNVTALNNFLKKISSKVFINEHQNGKIHFQFEKEKYIHTEIDFLRFILGPNPIAEFESLKLSPYISGLDSV